MTMQSAEELPSGSRVITLDVVIPQDDVVPTSRIWANFQAWPKIRSLIFTIHWLRKLGVGNAPSYFLAGGVPPQKNV